MAADIRLVQLTRILGLPHGLSHAEAEAAISARPADLADAFFLEAADSDDVTGVQPALEYVADRLAFFGALIAPPAAEAITKRFRERLRAWER